MRPKHQHLSHLHEKREVVVGAVCVDNRHGYAKLLALVSREQEVIRSNTRPVGVLKRDCSNLFKKVYATSISRW